MAAPAVKLASVSVVKEATILSGGGGKIGNGGNWNIVEPPRSSCKVGGGLDISGVKVRVSGDARPVRGRRSERHVVAAQAARRDGGDVDCIGGMAATRRTGTGTGNGNGVLTVRPGSDRGTCATCAASHDTAILGSERHPSFVRPLDYRSLTTSPTWRRIERDSRWTRGRRQLQVVNIGWDPEGILGPPKGGHIQRREMQRKMTQEDIVSEEIEKERRQQLERKRAERKARIVPAEDNKLVDYFVELEAGEMEFEIARCRSRLNDDFFAVLRTEIGSLRFSLNPNKMTEERLEALHKLETRLVEGVDNYDKMAAGMIQAKDRLVRLLSSKDKKQMILEMASENAIDRHLLALLDENAAAAQAQGQAQAAEFLTKLRMAVVKYIPV